MNQELDIVKPFPKEVAITLIVLGILISIWPIFFGINKTTLTVIVAKMALIFLAFPLPFVLIGCIQKIRDKFFNLWNMYYLGMAMALVGSLGKDGVF